MAIPTTTENYHELMDLAEGLVLKETHDKCLHASGSLIIWGGPTDQWEEDVWMNPYTKEPVEASFWESGQPNGGPIENCIRTYQSRKWQDTDCEMKNCAFCHFPTRMNLSMRGLCPAETKLMEGYFDLFYFISGFWANH